MCSLTCSFLCSSCTRPAASPADLDFSTLRKESTGLGSKQTLRHCNDGIRETLLAQVPALRLY